jgi:hypothetical protein
MMGTQQRFRVVAAARVPDPVALLLQRPHEALGEQRIVFDDEDALGHWTNDLALLQKADEAAANGIAAATPACCCRAPEE